jgi:hypothetical protein
MDEPRLHLAIEVRNRTKSRKLDYGENVAHWPALKDELGNGYTVIPLGLFLYDKDVSLGGESLSGSASIYPGKAHRTVLVFEKPVEAAKELRLTMPGAGVELDEAARLKIKPPIPN